jgi:hypothetical protein
MIGFRGILISFGAFLILGRWDLRKDIFNSFFFKNIKDREETKWRWE